MVAGQFCINFRAPGVNSAAQTLDVFETVALEISRRVHASVAFVIVDDEKIFPRPLAQNILHKLLREEICAGELHCVEFLPGTNVQHLNLVAGGEPVGEFTGLDLHRAIRFVTDNYVFDHFIDIQIFISRANAGERFIGAESTAAAPANMIASKQGTLRSGKLFQEFSHRDVGINRCCHVHQAINVSAPDETANVVAAAVSGGRARELRRGQCKLQFGRLRQQLDYAFQQPARATAIQTAMVEA